MNPIAARNKHIILIFVVILTIIILLFYQLLATFNIKESICIKFSSSSILHKLVNINTVKNEIDLSSLVSYSLDSECKLNVLDSSSVVRRKEFDRIFEDRIWNTVGSRSGPGSSLEGAFDWIRNLRTLFEHYSIRSMADLPCGDTYWQFSLREINTIEHLYFGGDISMKVIEQNKKLYGFKHLNKIFQYWDLVNCPIPTYTYKNATHEVKGNHFDLIIVRDALQHMHIRNGLKAVRNVILSGAKFFALTTYPPNGRSSASNIRTIGNNESLPWTPIECINKTYCQQGAITDGGHYANNINCHPFSFPLNKSILMQPSHQKFVIEHDEMHIYKIDDELKNIVQQYDKACL